MHIMPLKGIGSVQRANEIEWVFWATISAWDAICNIIPDIPNRMNCTIKVQMRTQWRRHATAI
jgi:hypothetical protein